ncbi:MAG: DUF1513 domain-containing protein [Thiothrix sp.]|nr:DUF1513 domain-containing protein [Thiothrix sp.]HPE60898.1 DUF1513 domain-containing protein [Thiolinea sp.]
MHDAKRRQLLQLAGAGILGAAAGAGMSQARAANAPPPPSWLFSACDHPDGGHFLTRLELNSGTRQNRRTPMRGHALTALPDGRMLMVGRRPAFESAIVAFPAASATATGADAGLTLLQATAGRHFDGHGCLSASGEVLFTTENAYERKRGVLGIRDSRTFEHLGEYETHGLDPHDIQLMPDGKTLVIANGGIEQHPDFGRRKLNLDTMQPSLVYLDADSGRKIDEYRLPDHQLSIRHLVVTAGADVGVALQYEGNRYRSPPASLAAWQAGGGELQLLPVEPEALVPFQGYMADLAYDPGRDILAVTSPRGNRVAFWKVRERHFLYDTPLPKPCGITFLAHQAAFLVSCGDGSLRTLHPAPDTVTGRLQHRFADSIWDNHLLPG